MTFCTALLLPALLYAAGQTTPPAPQVSKAFMGKKAQDKYFKVLGLNLDSGAVGLQFRESEVGFGPDRRSYIEHWVVVDTAGATKPPRVTLCKVFTDGAKGAAKKCRLNNTRRAAAQAALDEANLQKMKPRAKLSVHYNEKKTRVWKSAAGQKVVLTGRYLSEVEDAGYGDTAFSLTVDGELRFWDTVPAQIAMAGGPNGLAELYCDETRCLVVTAYDNSDMRGGSRGHEVSAPILLDSPLLFSDDEARALCSAGRKVSIVAPPGRVSTDGRRHRRLFRKAGCRVKGPKEARKVRAAHAVFAKPEVHDAVGQQLAAVTARGAKVELGTIDWQTSADWVLALPAPSGRTK